MSIDCRTSRIALRPCLGMVLALLMLTAGAVGQSMHPVVENGRTVWTNDSPKASRGSTGAVHKPDLVYWSNVEQRWKPVKPATPAAMRSARAVAGEVSSYIHSKPPLTHESPSSKELAAANPNYADAASQRSVKAVEIDKFIEQASARHHVDPNLVRAVIKVESNYNPHAVSNKGAMGLMQLMPATARKYDVDNPFDARQNVDAGVRHLKGLLNNFGGDVRLSLAAYNAGQGAVERNGGIPPYTETRNYVKRITNLMGIAPAGHLGSLAVPINVRRDERGRLYISNTD